MHATSVALLLHCCVHLFQGHVYYVDACGRPTEVLHCAECGAEIGGLDHDLLDTNQVPMHTHARTHAPTRVRAHLLPSNPT